MINLVSHLSYTQLTILFTILIMVCLKKLNIVVNVIKNHFNKELLKTKKDEDFQNSKCWICDSDYVDGDVKMRDFCHVTGKCRNSVHRDCNVQVKLIHKVPIVLHNLKYDSDLIMQELGKFDFKINVI